MPMHRIAFFICMLSLWAFLPRSLQAQGKGKNRFPQDWTGVWKGPMQWQQAGTAAPMRVEMELHILPDSLPGRWQFKIVYVREGKRDERPYLLVAQDSNYIHFVTDEQNSILLDTWRFDNELISRFQVNQMMLTSVYRLEGKRIYSSIISGRVDKPTATGLDLAPDTGVTQVLSFPLVSVQRAVLRKR